jgi:diadenylate cyclase
MQTIKELLYSIRIANIIDIGIIACLVYFVLAWLKGTRAFRILATLLGIGLFYYTTSEMGLILTSILFQYLWAAIIVVLVIVFQPEIREMLDRASPVRYLSGARNSEPPDIIDEVVKAVAELARHRLGALMVFQRMNRLDNLLLKGKNLDGVLSSEALVMIFQKSSPVHDGAVLVLHGRIKSVSCILPLSPNEDLSLRYGTRHRAALGLTEKSDALCVVVSEERGEVSLVEGKEITHYKKRADFREALEQGLSAAANTPDTAGLTVGGFLLSNWRIKLLSVITAMFLWFLVVGPQRSELGMTVPIQYTNLPPNMEITGQWMDRIDVRLRGSESGLANLKPGSVRAVVELSNVLPGLNCYRITAKNLMVPPGVTISEIRPSDLYLSIEAASMRRIAIVPSLPGDVPEKTKIVVSPAEAKVRGLQNDLKKITAVTTEPMPVSELLAKGKAILPVVVKPDGLRIESIEPMLATVTVETEK